MDKTYIKMSDFDEVQGLSKLLTLETKQGSLWVKADDHNVVIWASDMLIHPPAIKFIRLFRQNQLQEMIRVKKTPETDMDEPDAMLLDRFYIWLFKERGGKWPFYDAGRASMEQLWLAFCMSKKFGKVWSGNDWIKEK